MRERILQGDLPSIVQATQLRNGVTTYCYIPSESIAEESPFAGALQDMFDRHLNVWFDDAKGLQTMLHISTKSNALVSTGVVPALKIGEGNLVNDFNQWGDFCRYFASTEDTYAGQ